MLVLGSGPIRIGQGIEFDYSCVHCVQSLREMGYRAIIVNNNPETVSTDFDTGDGLYFEPVTLEDAMDVIAHERPIGVVCQFGGQTAINLAQGLQDRGVTVLGTTPEAIARAEDRAQFDAMLETLEIPRPRGRAVRSLGEAREAAREAGYPVLVRPSFVLGGRAMEIVYGEEGLAGFYALAEDANPGQPVLVDKYLAGVEAEVDVVSDGADTLVPGIMEHVERAGVHSGDSMAVYPPVTLSKEIRARMVRDACRIARELGVRGLMNIQFVVAPDASGEMVPYVLEVNPRASRTVPYLSKVTGVPMMDLAVRCMMGESLASLDYESGLWELSGGILSPEEPWKPRFGGRVVTLNELAAGAEPAAPIVYAVKAPVFSFLKLRLVEPALGPEMKSTGEILGLDRTYEGALYKALVASGVTFKNDGLVAITVRDADKPEAVALARGFVAGGYGIVATPGTAAALEAAGIACERAVKLQEGSPNLRDLLFAGRIALMVNTPGFDETSEGEAALIRRACIEGGIPCITSLDTAVALIRALAFFRDPERAEVLRLEEYYERR